MILTQFVGIYYGRDPHNHFPNTLRTNESVVEGSSKSLWIKLKSHPLQTQDLLISRE